MRIAVGMSGGVDSSVTVALLRQKGHTVVGYTMLTDDRNQDSSSVGQKGCYGSDRSKEIESARLVAELLGIEHRVLSVTDEFQEFVVDPFIREYLSGRTPTPCILCNREVKFGAFFHKIEKEDSSFDAFATGHYARIRAIGTDTGLFRAKDGKKDQTFFLYRLTRELLPRLLFPLGDLEKNQVREMARELGLHVHDKNESKGFYGGDYRDLLPVEPLEGPILHCRTGEQLATHPGFWNFTIGQRKGLGIDTSRLNEGLFVTSVDPRTNTIYVGGRADIRSIHFTVESLHWLVPSDEFQERDTSIQVRVGNTHPLTPARLRIRGDLGEVESLEPIIAVAPGQSAVFYREDRVLGGGFIRPPSFPFSPG